MVDPVTTWIEPDVEIEPTRVIHPFTVLRGRTVVRRGAEVGPARRRRRRGDREGRWSGRSVTFARERCLPRGPRLEPSWSSRTLRSARARRCRTSPTSAMRRWARGRTSARGTITANYPHEPGREKAPDDDRPERQDRDSQWFRGSCDDRRRGMDRRRLVHHRGRPARTRSRSLGPDRSPRRATCVESGTTELSLPGLGVTPEHSTQPHGERGRWTERGPSGKLMLFSGRSHPVLAQKIADQLEHRAGRRQAEDVRERRDLLPLQGVDPRRGRVHRPGLPRPRDERLPLGAPDHDPGGEARLRQPHHGGHALVPLLAAGQEVGAARADHREAPRGRSRGRGNGPRPHDGPPRWPDPGILPDPGRPHDRAPALCALLPRDARAARRGRRRRLARPRIARRWRRSSRRCSTPTSRS